MFTTGPESSSLGGILHTGSKSVGDVNFGDSCNPHYLHHSDNPGAVLVSQLLNGDNYPTWSRAMTMALSAKNKLGFVDGSLPQPDIAASEFMAWMRCNHMAGEGEEWWSEETVAVVTGANRGIGLEVCRQFAEKGLTVIMTARKPQEKLSNLAQQFLATGAEGKNVIFHTLDISKDQSVLDFVDWLKLHVGFVDILINNAGVNNSAIDWGFVESNGDDKRAIMTHLAWANGGSDRYESARGCLETNFYGTKRLTKALLPFLRPSSHKPRIVNVSSRYGLLCLLRDDEFRKELSDMVNLTEEKIDQVLDMFLEEVKSEKGMDRWPVKLPTYSISKISLNAYTRLLALQLHDKACVNSVHPGYVTTDMTFGMGDLSPAEVAANLVRVALLPPSGPSGHNFLESKDVGF